jgi:hypothetical protein
MIKRDNSWKDYKAENKRVREDKLQKRQNHKINKTKKGPERKGKAKI